LYAVFVWGRKVLNREKRRFSARAVQKASTAFGSELAFVDVNCDSDELKPLCQAEGVQSYPTLKLFKAHGPSEKYDGGRTFADLVAFGESLAPFVSTSGDAAFAPLQGHRPREDGQKRGNKKLINEIAALLLAMEERQNKRFKRLEVRLAKIEKGLAAAGI
jgi:hypothetical protein